MIPSFGAPVGRLFFSKDEEVAFLRGELRTLQTRLDAAETVLKDASAEPAPVATVIEVRDKKSTIAIGGRLVEVRTPTHLKAPAFRPSAAVHVDPKTNGIIDVVEDHFSAGQVRQVVRVVDGRHVELEMVGVSAQGLGLFVVLYDGEPPEPGDRVLLDPSGMIVTRNLGQPKAAARAPVETHVTWDDIGGMAEAKRDLIEAIESPVVDRELHARYGKKRARGVLLCGPPGCGKTMLARAAASALARLHGKESTASGFRYVAGPELLHPLVGNSESNVRRVFDEARRHFEEHGYPAVVCLDEADALLARRGSVRMEGMERTIVPQFLAMMDGLGDSGAFVMVCTNRPDMLDPAITRDGRLDIKVLVRRPTQSECVDILGKHLAGKPLHEMTVEEAAQRASEQLFHDRHVLYMLRTKSGKDRRLTLGSFASGAACEGLVERATAIAMRREKATGAKGGIAPGDLAEAADRMCAEQKMLDHAADVLEAVEALRDDYRGVEKVKA